MLLRRLISIFFVLFFIPALAFSARPHPAWNRRPGVVLYQLKNSLTTEQTLALRQVLSQTSASLNDHVIGVRSHQSRRWMTTVRSEEEHSDDLMATGAVTFAEPDYALPAARVPNDPRYSAQPFFNQIHAPAAWDVTTGTSSVLVAICDTGIDATHPDLIGNLSLPGINIVDGTTNTSPIADHGTAVAGILAAVGNNALGVTGMAWTVSVLPVRITNQPDTTAWCSDMARGIEWAADHGAKVINLSYETGGCPGAINAAAQVAYGLGALVTVAAGNDSDDLSTTYPHGPGLLLVAGLNTSGGLASFSNYGTAIDLMAPGTSMLTTQPSNGYGVWNGTSFASPLVAGTAALIWSLHPSFTPDQVELFLDDTADGLGQAPGQDAVFGRGLLDAGAALAAAQGFLNGTWSPPAVTTTPNPLPPTTPPDPPGATATIDLGTLDNVRVYPNPWRADRHAGRDLTFDHLTSSTILKIFTVSGRLIKTLSSNGTSAAWDLLNDSGERAASGLYLYLLKDAEGHKTSGQFALLR